MCKYKVLRSYDFAGGLSTLLETSELMCPGTVGRPLGIPAGGKKNQIRKQHACYLNTAGTRNSNQF